MRRRVPCAPPARGPLRAGGPCERRSRHVPVTGAPRWRSSRGKDPSRDADANGEAPRASFHPFDRETPVTVDFDEPRVQSEYVRRARKLHTCCECRNEIRPGDYYRVDSGIDADRHAYTYKTCLACVRIRNWLMDEMSAGRLHDASGVDGLGRWVFEMLGESCRTALEDWAVVHGRCRRHWWLPHRHPGATSACR